MCCFRKFMSLQALWLCVVITYAVIEGDQATFPAGTSTPPLADASDTSTTNEVTTSAAGTTATEKDKSNFSGLCYIFDRYICKNNSILHNISIELEPTCYPTIERCESNHCSNVFNRMSDDDNPDGVLRDGWNGDILWSECAIARYFNPEKNDVNQCKNATVGSYNTLRYIKDGSYVAPAHGTPYDYNKCTCKGLLCNSYSPEGMIYRYNQYRTIGPIPRTTVPTNTADAVELCGLLSWFITGTVMVLFNSHLVLEAESKPRGISRNG